MRCAFRGCRLSATAVVEADGRLRAICPVHAADMVISRMVGRGDSPAQPRQISSDDASLLEVQEVLDS